MLPISIGGGGSSSLCWFKIKKEIKFHYFIFILCSLNICMESESKYACKNVGEWIRKVNINKWNRAAYVIYKI